MKKITTIRKFLLLLLALGLGCAAHAQPLRIGSWEKDGHDQLTQSAGAILRQAYAQLRMQVEFIDLPVRRALQMLVNEELDGNTYRIAGLSAEYPQLVQVDTPIGFIQVRGYALGRKDRLSGWGQLNGLRVAYLRGVLAIERSLPTGAQGVEAKDIDEAFKLYSAGAADIVVLVEPAGLPANPGAVALDIPRLDGALGELPVHHYLLKRHSALALQLNGVFKKMQASGQMDAIRKKAAMRTNAKAS